MRTGVMWSFVSIAPGALLMPLQGGTQEASGGWKPFIRDKRGAAREFPADPCQVPDRDWLNLGYPESACGFKPRLGVVLSDENAHEKAPVIQNETLRVLITLSQKNEEEQKPTVPMSHYDDEERGHPYSTSRLAGITRLWGSGSQAGGTRHDA